MSLGLVLLCPVECSLSSGSFCLFFFFLLLGDSALGSGSSQLAGEQPLCCPGPRGRLPSLPGPSAPFLLLFLLCWPLRTCPTCWPVARGCAAASPRGLAGRSAARSWACTSAAASSCRCFLFRLLFFLRGAAAATPRCHATGASEPSPGGSPEHVLFLFLEELWGALLAWSSGDEGDTRPPLA